MTCCPQIGRFIAGSLLGLAAVAGCSGHDFAGAATTSVADRPQPPGAASTSEPTPPAHLSVVAAAPVWTSATPTVPRAVSQPDPYVPKVTYAPAVDGRNTNPQAAVTAAQQRDLRVMTFNLRVRTVF